MEKKKRKMKKIISATMILLVAVSTFSLFTSSIAWSNEITETIFLYATEDAMVLSFNPDSNFGDSEILEIGTGRLFFIKFDLSAVPGNVTIVDIRLYLYKWHFVPLGNYPNIGQCWSLLDDSWNEYNITWNNMPSEHELLDEVSLVPYECGWFNWTITSYIQSEYTMDKVASLLFKMRDGYYSWFASREFGIKPRLCITYKTVPQPTIKFYPTDDSFVLNRPGKVEHSHNYGASWGLTTDDGTGIIYVKFNLSNLTGMIKSATLNLYRQIGPNRGLEIDVYSLFNDSWEEETITGANRPLEADLLTSYVGPAEDVWFEIDVTSFVQSEYMGDKVVSFVIKDGGVTFRSKEGAESGGAYFNLREGGFCPYLEITLALIEANIGIDPNTLNLKSNGQWITAFIELPEGYNVSNIDVNSILLNGTISVDVEAPITVGDYDLDNISDLMVKFDRAAIIEWLNTNDYSEDTGKYCEISLTITGTVAGIQFTGTDKMKVLKK